MADKSQNSKEKKKKAFIISPIGKENSVERLRFSGIYELVYAPVFENLGFECEPIVDELRPGSIFSQIMDHLLNDDLVICDLTDNNPNVMYELAIRHIIRKPVVMIIEKLKDDLKIPFDIQEDRIFDFPSNQAGLAKLKKTLPELIKKAMLSETEINNPITRHINLKSIKLSLEASENEPLKILFNEVAEIKEKLQNSSIMSNNLASVIERRRYELDNVIAISYQANEEINKKILSELDEANYPIKYTEHNGDYRRIIIQSDLFKGPHIREKICPGLNLIFSKYKIEFKITPDK